MRKDHLLHTPSPGGFEELVVRICHQILGFGTISFGSGKDGGRDAFFDGTARRFPSEADPSEHYKDGGDGSAIFMT